METQKINLHDKNITLSIIQSELREHPSRLEEKKRREDDDEHRDRAMWNEFGLEYSSVFDNGCTPLMSAAEFGNVMVVEFLLEIGAYTEAFDKVFLLDSFHMVVLFF